MLFQVTYRSDGFKVKGYLGLPPGLRFTAEQMQATIEQIYNGSGGKTEPPLPVALVTEALRPEGPGASPSRGKYPALLYCRGGLGKVGRVQQHWVDSFANRGYVVLAPCYRGNEGGEGRDEFGGADREDSNAAFRLLQALPFVEASRVSVMGFSRGAINAAMTAADMDAVHRLILWGGVSDLAATYEERVDLRRTLKRIVGGSPAKNPEGYLSRSPLHYAEQWRCPVLIIHGTNDVQVDVGHGLRMLKRLRELGAPADAHMYEGSGHHLPFLPHEAAIDRMFDWIDEIN